MPKQLQVVTKITEQTISDLLSSAFEAGGSKYWCNITACHKPPKLEFRTDQEHIYKHLDYPLNPGGALTITTVEGDVIAGKKSWRLNRKSIQAGLQIMADKHMQHFAMITTDDADSVTADVFLQCCLFGDIIYG